MKNSRTLALAAVVALALAAQPSSAAGQATGTPPAGTPQTVTGRPPIVDAHASTPTLPKSNKPKLDKYKGRVLAFNMATIVVQSIDNQRMVWSFQYSTEMRIKVADMLTAGPYQPGDKVEVYCTPGTTIAVKFKGKPSKSS